MRIYESRSARDRQRWDLAQRMARLGARTRTAARCTALSPHRIRQITKDVVGSLADDGPLPRWRSARSVEFLWRSVVLQLDAALLGGLLRHYQAAPAGHWSPLSLRLDRMERVCDVVEVFARIRPRSALHLEHGILLLDQLSSAEEFELCRCARCRALMLKDRGRLDGSRCPLCRTGPPTPQEALGRLLRAF